MGLCTSRSMGRYPSEKDARMFIQKMKCLQQEINAMLKQREEDNEVYEKEMMMFTINKAEWKKEKKKLREEVKQLRRSLEERENKIKELEGEAGYAKSGKSEEQSESLESSTTASLLLVEQMREERARRDEAVEKWKMLYLAIKNELDDLIEKTHQGVHYWRTDDEDLMQELQMELKVKDERIEVLKAQVASLEDETYKRKREVDILRQSLKIMSNKKGAAAATSLKGRSGSKPSVHLSKSLIKLTFVN